MQRRASMTLLVWWFAPFIVASALHVILLGIGSELAGLTKIALMPLLALAVAAFARRVRPRAAVALLFAALLFSWLGDSVGAFFPTAPELPLMLGFFGLAHVAYILLFARHLARKRMPWWALVSVAWWIAMLIILGPHTGGLFIAVAAYGLVLAGTAAFAARCSPVIAVGAAFFLASDTILALRLFLPDGLPAWSDPAIMFTYTIGQGLIVAGAVLALQNRSIDA
ncbi:lysoplasmalogenase [Microbacterium oxydans]|nr:lysoplasmalogenase [Microbacterium oxydans]